MSKATSLHGDQYAEAFRTAYVVANSGLMPGGKWLYEGNEAAVVKKMNGTQTDGDIDAGFVLAQDSTVSVMLETLSGAYINPGIDKDQIILAGTFIHFELTAKTGSEIPIKNKKDKYNDDALISYMQQKIKFHRRCFNRENQFVPPVGTTGSFLVLVFNGMDHVPAHEHFKNEIEAESVNGTSVYAGFVNVTQWSLKLEMDAREAANDARQAANDARQAANDAKAAALKLEMDAKEAALKSLKLEMDAKEALFKAKEDALLKQMEEMKKVYMGGLKN